LSLSTSMDSMFNYKYILEVIKSWKNNKINIKVNMLRHLVAKLKNTMYLTLHYVSTTVKSYTFLFYTK